MESLNRHFAAIAEAAFQRHGFASLGLAAQWREIVGSGPAAEARPEQIKWPHKTAGGKKQGGTLVLRVPAALALDIHYDTPRIIERVNQFLGYGAIAAVKVVNSGTQPKAPSPPRRAAPVPEIKNVTDPDLAAALGRLGSAVASENSLPRRSPQGKSGL